ncbi:MAG: FG-GAP-like repeat-containing protein [Candidatus Cloacimonadota bacterium]|nr:FG-GAP-like repeat-containing protein [Candidatus Cloacimonadota bacterium]
MKTKKVNANQKTLCFSTKVFSALLFFLIFISISYAQTFYEITTNGWGQGMRMSKPVFMDIDEDGLLDMFITDGCCNGNIKHFEQASGNSYKFILITQKFNDIEIKYPSAPAFADIDGDGLLDMLIGEQDGNINHYEQVSSGSYAFNLITENFNDISEWHTVPFLLDIDNDGLLDLIVGKCSGQISHYEQVSEVSYDFDLISEQFNGIDVGNFCTPTVTDIDGDGLLDLIIGEGEESGNSGGNIFHYEQNSQGSYDFTLVTDNFNEINVGRFSAPTFTDVDDDGLLDLFIGELDGNINLYEQDSAGDYDFNLITEYFVVIDVGRFSIPTFADVDGDDLLDMFIGEYDGNINHYEQVSTGSYEFTFLSDNFCGINLESSKPTITDIDNDGLWDMIVGEWRHGHVLHYEQTTAGSYDFTLITENFVEVNFGGSPAFHFTDIDDDGLLDLLVGVHTGNIGHYEQDSENSYNFTLISENFSGIDVGSYAVPTSCDIDEDGLLDLLIGKQHNGRICHYEQVSEDSYDFILIDPRFKDINREYRSAPTFADIDGDGLEDFLIGAYDGGICFYKRYNEIAEQFTKITEGDIVNDNGWSMGCSWADYDDDGYLDLYITNTGSGSPFNPEENFLYANNGNGTFTKITTGDIVNDVATSHSSSWSDYNNDGYVDLFVANSGVPGGPNSLYQNNGDGTFTSITNGPIVEDMNFTQNGVWGDFDNDGNLDLMTTSCMGTYLYRNNGDGTFAEMYILNEGYYKGVACADYDNDGNLDVFLTKYVMGGANNALYRNNGDGTFTRIIEGAIVNDGGSSPGGSWGDYNNDGDLDLFVPNTDINFLYQNNGDGTFTKITEGPIVIDEGTSRSGSWGDFDNDGDLDLFVTNGYGENNFLYENMGDGTFIRITQGDIANDGGYSIGCSWADYDNDGDLDLFVTNTQEPNFLYRNETGNNNNWINIKCIGIVSNTSAIGAKVRIKAVINGIPVWQTQEISGQTNAWGQNSLNVEFGLGDATIIDSLVIEWPSGRTQTLMNIDTNQFLTIEEGQDELGVDTVVSRPDEDVLVAVYINENQQSFSSADIILNGYTEGVEFLDLIIENSLVGDANWIYEVNEIDGNLLIALAGSEDITGDGILFWLKFHTGVSEGFVPINIVSALFNADIIPTLLTNGGIEIVFPDYGDVDQNGFVQSFDASLILKYLVGLVVLDPYQQLNADVTIDNTISALDATFILQYIVGIIDSLPYPITGDEYLASGIPEMYNQTILPGEIIDVPINLTCVENIYSFEATVEFNPDDLEYLSSTFAEILEDFIIEENLDGGLVKFSGTGLDAVNNDGELLILHFAVKEDFNSDSTFVGLNQLRWNEDDVQMNCAQAKLTNSLSISNEEPVLCFDLSQNYPNPFKPETLINYSIKKESRVILEVYNIKGQKVITLVNEKLKLGYHSVVWDGKDDSGKPVSNGIYFYKLSIDKSKGISSERTNIIKKMIILK